ncbi:MAG: efflux RND transporter periplasmic adaptor subunit [Allomuricauda sp.]
MKYLVFSVIGAYLLLACSGPKEKTYPQKLPMTESVYASATVQPDSLYHAYSVATGILEHIWVEEGDTVSKGDLLLQISNTSPEMNKENARLALELAQKNYTGTSAVLNSIKDEIEAAVLQLGNDSINFYRQKKLWDQNIGSKVEFDNKKLAYELARNRLDALKKKFERTKNELETQLRQAENNYRSSLTNTNDFTITSKINGTVYALYKNLGEIVTTVEPVATLGMTNRFVVELLVDEVDIIKLRRGQKVYITLDSYGDTVFQGTVHKIYPRKDERSQTFTVEAIFNTPPETLYPGLSGEGNIVISETKEALVIPKTYLINGSTVLTDEGETQVTTGLENMSMVEILDGIDEHTALYPPEP